MLLMIMTTLGLEDSVIKRLFSSFAMSAFICTGASAGEPITVRGIHGAMSLEELTTALDQIDGIVYTLETNDSFPCIEAPTVSVFDESLTESIPNFYPEKLKVEGFTGQGAKLVGCFHQKHFGPSYNHSIAVFNMEATSFGRMYGAHYKCAFFEGCNINVHQLAKDFQTSQRMHIPLKEYPKSPDGTLFQAVTEDGEAVGIRQDGSILIISVTSKFFTEGPSSGNKPKFQ